MKKIIGLLLVCFLLSSCLTTLDFFKVSNKQYVVKSSNIEIMKIYYLTDMDKYVWIINIKDPVLFTDYDSIVYMSAYNKELIEKIENGKYTMDVEITYNYESKNITINPIFHFYLLKKCNIEIEKVKYEDLQKKGTEA